MPSNNPPRQCAAFSIATDDLCGRDTYDVIEMGLAMADEPNQWEILVEVPICDQHDALMSAVQEEVDPMTGAEVKDLDGDSQVMPTFRMSVSGRST